MYDFLNIKHSLVLINFIVIEDVRPHCNQLHLLTQGVWVNELRPWRVWWSCSVIIWETFIEGLVQWLSFKSGWFVFLSFLWVSLDHHGNSNIVVISWVLGLGSILLENGIESIVTNNFSESLKSNWLDVIQFISWGSFDSNSGNFINWDLDQLRSLVSGTLGFVLSSSENNIAWSWSGRVAALV